MSTTKKAAIAAVPKSTKPRVKPMSMAQKFEFMKMVKDASPSASDASLAVLATTHFGRKVNQQTVAGYRKEFGLATVRKPTSSQLEAHIQALSAQLVDAGMVPVDRDGQHGLGL